MEAIKKVTIISANDSCQIINAETGDFIVQLDRDDDSVATMIKWFKATGTECVVE